MSMGALIEKFRTIGLDRLERMNALLVALERAPNDPAGVEELLREIHTLKGEAKMMGFVDVNLVAHQTENVLLAITAPKGITDTAPADLIFEGLDLMRGLLTKSAGGEQSKNLDLNAFVDQVASFGRDQERAAVAVPAVPEEPPGLSEESDFSIEPMDGPQADFRDEARNFGRRTTRTRIKATNQERPQGSEPAAGSLRIQTSTSMRIEVEKLERIGDIAGETLLMSRRLGYRLGDLESARQELRQLFQKVEGHLPKSQSMALRNLIHRFDATESALREECHRVSLRASQLDDQSRHLRHIPLAQVLSHYPRAVRDLANAQGKRVRLIDTFGSVDVDRALLSALSEPLLHLVRNAVDHGIEPPEERIGAGKEPEGEITLSADYVGDSIRVVLSDDGAGIDPQRIRQRAEERNFLSAERARRLSDQEAIALIFEPGFSTQETANDISGRGIGMNVVRDQITRIGGFIEIESEVGQGTTFTLHLPVTSAINAILVFTIGAERFALPAKDVERVEMVTRSSLKKAHGALCLHTGDGLIPLVDWTTPLGLPPRAKAPEVLTVLVVKKGARRVAVWVDDVLGEREAMSRPLGDFLNGVRLCRGVAITDSGAVVPLLNVVDLIERTAADARLHLDAGPATMRSFTISESPAPARTRTILVVEDSEVTRSLVVSILKNHGYRIVEADDGNHGWSMLQRHNIDLVLSDVQMPGMDGLTLLQHIRASEQFARLPVVILTTLGGAEDKKKAMRLGANGYLAKLSFQEQDLIDTVKRYLG